jgi:Transketolase, N-terminal subunit
MATIAELQDISTQVRRDIVRMVNGASSGHPGGSLDCADLLTALYFQVLDINPNTFTKEGNGEDMFFLSNGHISPVWYSVLARRGYFPVKELSTFRKLGTRLQGHPSVHDNLPGVRIASGSLGQGLSVALGAAQAKKMNEDKHLIYVLGGDGELEEGQVWEGVMYAGAKKVDNLISIIDYNKVQIDGTTDQVCSLGDLKQRYLASGWRVLEMNGNEMKDTLRGLVEAKEQTGFGQPVLILMHTQMGYGVDFMCGKNSWHGKAPSDQEAVNALSQLKETLGDY